jgi:hypothetical protein
VFQLLVTGIPGHDTRFQPVERFRVMDCVPVGGVICIASLFDKQINRNPIIKIKTCFFFIEKSPSHYL